MTRKYRTRIQDTKLMWNTVKKNLLKGSLRPEVVWLSLSTGDHLTLWMLDNFQKIDYIVVWFLKPVNSACFFMGDDRLSGKQVGSQASRRVTRQLAWIQPVCISINVVPALKGLRKHLGLPTDRQTDPQTDMCKAICPHFFLKGGYSKLFFCETLCQSISYFDLEYCIRL